MKKAILACCCLIPLFLACAENLFAGPQAAVLFESGKKHFEAGNYQGAVESFSRALQNLEPEKSNTHLVRLARAQAYYGKGDLKKAWADLSAVLESDDLDGETKASGLMLRGTLYLSNGRDKKAFDDFTAAINASHKNTNLRSQSLTNRGIAFINRGQIDRAIQDLNQAISLSPRSGFAHAARGLAYLRSDMLDAARLDGEKAMNMNPDPPTATIAEKILRELSGVSSSPHRVSVPLNEHGQIFVQVRFSKNGSPHRFLVDTGATYTVMDRKLLAEIGRETRVEEVGKSRVVLADGSTHPVTRYRVRNAFLFDLPLGSIEVHAFDRKAKGVINLLGTRSLAHVTISIDNSSRKVIITRRDPALNRVETN